MTGTLAADAETNTSSPRAPRRGPPREKARHWVSSVSLANLAFLRAWMLFGESRWWRYSGTRAAGLTDLTAVVLDIGLLAVAIWFLGRLLAASRVGRVFAELLLVTIGLLILNDVRILLQMHVYLPAALASAGPTRRAALAAVGLVAGLTIVRWSSRITWIVTRAALVFSPLVVLNVGSAVWSIVSPAPRVTASALPTASPRVRRVLVYVFDEMDFSNSAEFLRGRPGTALAALADQASSSTNAHAPALNTNESLASFMIGRPVLRATSTDRGGLRLLEREGADVTTLRASVTVLEEMRARGIRVGLVGWYLPYCRMRLAESLSRCSTFSLLPDQLERTSLLATMSGLASNRSFVSRTWQALSAAPQQEHHQRLVRAYADSARLFAADTSLDVVIFHVPVPHAPWLDADAASPADGYRQNSIEADSILGQTLAAARRADPGATPVVIVTADHQWREARQAGALVDERVPLLVSFGASTPGSSRADRVVTTELFRLAGDIASGKLASPESVIDAMRVAGPEPSP